MVPIASSEYPTPAARPRYSVLDTAHVARTFGVVATPWLDQLDRVLDAQFATQHAAQPALVHHD